MNRKQIVLGIVLADFSAFTAYAVWKYGFVGVFVAPVMIALLLSFVQIYRELYPLGGPSIPPPSE